MVEVKCLKAENHIAAMIYFRKNGTCPTDYVQQTQGQMWIAERKWVDLICYHPMLPMFVIHQMPNQAIIDGLSSGIENLISERDLIVAMLRGQS